ncbi:Vacuolar protein sorting-associated protein [Globisporangium polare]
MEEKSLSDVVESKKKITEQQLGLSARLSIEEIKIVLQAHSEAPQLFETWMKSVIDANEDGYTRDATSVFGGNAPGSPRRQRHDAWGRKPSLPKAPASSTIAEITATGLSAKVDADSLNFSAQKDGSTALYEFSLQNAVIRDKIADPEECITDLFESAAPAKLPRSLSYRRSLSSPTRTDGNNKSRKFELQIEEDSSSSDLNHPVGTPQLSVRMETQPKTLEGTVRCANSMVVSLTSARVNVLPRTLLRLEHFGMETYMAVTKRVYQLQAQYKPRMLISSSAARNHGYMDGFAESRGDEDGRSHALNDRMDSSRMELYGFTSARRNSISESMRDGEGKKLIFMSPVNTQSLGNEEDRHGKLTTSDLTSSLHDIVAEAEEERSEEAQHFGDPQVVESSHEPDSVRVWMVHVELSNLQLWLLSTDKKAEAAGVKLSANLVADLSTFNGEQNSVAPPRRDLLVGSGEINRVELSISTPIEERADADSRGTRGSHFPWTIVEPFSIHADFRSSHCVRPLLRNESKDLETPKAAGAVSFEPVLPFDEDHHLFPSTLSQVPLDWDDWVLHQPSVKVDQIASRVSYRNLPVLLKIASSLSSAVDAEDKVRETFAARLKSIEEEFGWNFSDDAHDEIAHFQSRLEEEDEDQVLSHDMHHEKRDGSRSVVHSSLQMDGAQFRVINNIVDQESPVIGVNIGRVTASHFSTSNSEMEASVMTTVDAWYHNLRLVTSEPLIEPWRLELLVSRKPKDTGVADELTGESDQTLETPTEVKVVSNETLQVNVTEAFIANLMAANRAWKWVVNEGGDPREMTEYSTYWIRNNTGLNLHYWGESCKASTLLSGGEEPLEFAENGSSEDVFFNDRNVNNQSGGGFRDRRMSNGERNNLANYRQIFVAVFEDEDSQSDEQLSSFERKWQSETAIPVDQVDSRMYALVNSDSDIFSGRLRKCECVIDVLLERGCKVFVVRSTLLVENNTGSDLEVEFMPPPAQFASLASRADASKGSVVPSWKAVVKTSAVVPVPLHLVSLGEGQIVTRPPEIKSTDANGQALPKPYAKERVRLPLFDRDSLAESSDDLGDAQSTMKFHRLLSDRPVRPFIMRACLSSSNGALYHRTLSFHPPLVIHNLTAGPLEFCLSTPNDWVPAAEAGGASAKNIHLGWEDSQQRLRERGTINVADTVTWHLSDWDTPLELSVRMKGFEWSEPILVGKEVAEFERIKMKDLVTDSFLYITAESEMRESRCREIFLYVPYWIVNLTGLKLEYEYDDERMGGEHLTTLLAGQKRLDREELLLKENQRAKLTKRERNAHLVHAPFIGSQQHERKRRHPCLLPSVPPIKGLLDLLPKSIDDPKALGQLEVLQVCHSDYRSEKGCVRLRVNDDELSGGIESAKENAQRKWSEVMVLDQTGTSGEVETADYGTSRNYSIGYSISTAKGRYSRTKVVMLTPRFMLVNTLGCAIEVCHSSAKFSTTTTSTIDIASSVHLPNNGMMSSMNSVVHLEAGAYADFHWTLRFGKTRAIRCRIAEYGWSWSGAVPLGESGEYAVRMRHESTRESKLLRLTLKLDGSCVCVYFREESASAPPYRVENYSLETLRIHQYRVRRSEILLPHHSLDYAWDEPTQERMLVVDMLPSAAGDNSRPLRIGTFALDKIQRYPDALGGTLGIEVSTDGPTRVLRFTDARLRGDRNNEILALGSEAVGAKSKKLGQDFLRRFVSAPSLHLSIQLQGIGISLVDGVPKELVYASISGINLEMIVSEEDREKSSAFIAGSDAAVSRLERETTPRIMACRFEVGDIQIDNQLQTTPFPVLLRFSNSASRSQNVDGEVVNVPALQIYLVKHDEYAGINFIRYFSARALPVHIRVDGSLLSHLAPLVMHGNAYGTADHLGKATRGGGGSTVSQGLRNSLLLEDFNASLEVNVKILEAIREEEATTSVAPSNLSMRTNRSKPEGSIAGVNSSGEVATSYSTASIPFYPTQGRFTSKEEDKKLYFEEFYIDPIRATVSFSFGSGVGAIADEHYGSHSSSAFADSSRASSSITVGPLRLILNAIGTSLTKIANAPFKLKRLEISHSFMQPDALATRLTSHYQSEALRQAYVILGSVDVLGNPMIAWKNLKVGFQDFIYEPAYGITKSPKEFAFGMGRGTLSLVRASVYTFLDFNSRILTASSLGLSEACLKLDDYTGYPATRNIYQGFAQGISGIVVSPIHSVEVNGVRGVIPGIFAGVFGLVLKPLLGFSLAAATTTATLRDAVDPNTKALLMRVRPPRFIDLRTRRLKVYSYVESLGEEIVSKLRGGRYRADGYLGHVDLKQKCLLVTRKRILLLEVRGAQKYEVEWELLAEEMILVESKGHDEMTIYYIREDFSQQQQQQQQRSRVPVALSGMLMSKYVVALPDNKILFVRAMLQQMERSLITKLNSGGVSGGGGGGSSADQAAQGGWAVASSPMDRSPWPPSHQQQQRGGAFEYPMFRIPALLPASRSFTSTSNVPH